MHEADPAGLGLRMGLLKDEAASKDEADPAGLRFGIQLRKDEADPAGLGFVRQLLQGRS